MKKILLVEDDQDLVNLLLFNLKENAFDVDAELSGDAGFARASSEPYDLIILDINLPKKNGLDICRDLRTRKIDTPIIMLTARTEEIDRILGLEFGADDYISKPFSHRELVARINAVFRRVELSQQAAPQKQELLLDRGNLKINTDKRKVILDGEVVNLTPTEYELLMLLASNPGKIYPKEALLNKVWGYEYYGFKHTVSSHINRLRSKIEQDMNEPKYILTSWGVGYQFTEAW